MPRKPINYDNTVIYKIVSNDLNVHDVYVGSTTDFSKRKALHKSACNNPSDYRHNLKLYKIIRDNGGWSNFSMLEIEKFKCVDKNEAAARERYHFEQLHANMNNNYPNRKINEYHVVKNDCPCGGRFTNANRVPHTKSSIHQNYLKAQGNDDEQNDDGDDENDN
jgi:hypothetical protein